MTQTAEVAEQQETSTDAITMLLDCLRASGLEGKSHQDLDRIQDLLNAAQLQLLNIFTEPLVDRVEPFLTSLRRAGSIVATAAGPQAHQAPAYYLGQLDAMAELGELTRRQKIPQAAARVLINFSDAHRIAAIVFEHGSIGLARLADKLGKPSQNLHGILREMQAAQLLRRDDLGRNVLFSPTPLTRAAIHWGNEEASSAPSSAAAAVSGSRSQAGAD
ncbi:MAG: hypothetical protein LAO24_18255 [Acidobacteriia bacterium]|nr:hypothetical protein [Terriglobia bacterium]